MYRNMVLSTAALMVVLGVVMIGLTIAYAGFGVGIVLGLLFVAAGSMRIWLLTRRAR